MLNTFGALVLFFIVLPIVWSVISTFLVAGYMVVTGIRDTKIEEKK